MSQWRDVLAAEPGFASRVQRIFDQRKHKTLATLRADGSPRISGIEAEFAGGDLWLGMMPYKVSGRAVRAQRPDRPTPPATWLRIDIDEVVLTYVSDPPASLVIESWHPGRGLERKERT